MMPIILLVVKQGNGAQSRLANDLPESMTASKKEMALFLFRSSGYLTHSATRAHEWTDVLPAYNSRIPNVAPAPSEEQCRSLVFFLQWSGLCPGPPQVDVVEAGDVDVHIKLLGDDGSGGLIFFRGSGTEECSRHCGAARGRRTSTDKFINDLQPAETCLLSGD